MRHDSTPCDADMAAWVAEREQAVCPEASRVVGRCEEPVDAIGAARFCAEALRLAAAADVGLHERGRILNPLPQGNVDVNALYMTSRPGDDRVVVVPLTGRELLDYVAGATAARPRCWAGFDALIEYGNPAENAVVSSDVEPERLYRAAMTEAEWKDAVVPGLTEVRAAEAGAALEAVPRPGDAPAPGGDATITDALTAYADHLTAEGVSLDAAQEALQPAAAE